jgi:hypothetical protein
MMNNWTRRDFLRIAGATATGLYLGAQGLEWEAFPVWAQDTALDLPFDELKQIVDDSVDPVLSAQLGKAVRIPNTSPVHHTQPALHTSELQITPLFQAKSLLGHPITSTRDPLQDLELALYRLQMVAMSAQDNPLPELNPAREVLAILEGNTQGRVYDGFALLNFNRGAITPAHIPG